MSRLGLMTQVLLSLALFNWVANSLFFHSLAEEVIPSSWEEFQRHGPPLLSLGHIRTRSASEIKNSSWSVGCETLDRDYTVYDNYRDYVGPLGAVRARIQAGWAKCEKAKGIYEWAWLDHVIDDLLHQGVHPWVCICYGNPIYPGGGTPNLGGGLPQSDEALAAWDRWVEAMVKRYRGRVIEWEIWNEPDLGRTEERLPQYVKLFVRTAETIRTVDPQAKILALAVCSPTSSMIAPFLKELQRQDKLHLVDAITFHGYTRRPEDLYRGVVSLQNLVREFDPRIELIQGEAGCPSVEHPIHALAKYPWTEFSQPKWYLRRMLGDFSHRLRSSVFTIVDIRYPEVLLSMGLLRANDNKEVLYKKPAYYAVQHAMSVFDSSVRPSGPVDVSYSGERSVRVVACQKGDQPLLAIWFDGEVPSNSLDWVPVDLSLENVRFRSPVYVELITGRAYHLPPDSYRQEGPRLTFKNLPLWDSPILIMEQTQLELRSDQ